MDKLTGILRQYQHIIWDWNGTILDDLQLAISTLNKQLRRQGLELITENLHKNNFFFPIEQYYRSLGLDFESISYRQLADDFARDYFNDFHHAQVFPGMREFLHSIKRQGTVQSILSASFQEHLLRVVKFHGLEHLFDHLYGIEHLLADSKVQRGKELLRATHIPTHLTVLVGDTLHDWEVGQELGIDVVLLADGHQS